MLSLPRRAGWLLWLLAGSCAQPPAASVPSSERISGVSEDAPGASAAAPNVSSGGASSNGAVEGAAPSVPDAAGASSPAPASAPEASSLEPASPDDGASPTESAAPPGSAEACAEVTELHEVPPKTEFSVDGYAAQTLKLRLDGSARTHCIVVAWPKGRENNAGKSADVARHIDAAWFRAIENTLRRVPRHHAETLRRVVIDNHPTQHGIAAFDRRAPDDGRDGHTIWLHEHLFRAPNHWEHGIRGDFYAYHTNIDGKSFDGSPPEHDLFSPVLLHELGHLVMYHYVNPPSDPVSTPACARTCSDEGNCEVIDIQARELPCISPYCRPFKYTASTENWAEQYRFFYQSSTTRGLLTRAAEVTTNCLDVLRHHDAPSGHTGSAPWERGLPDDGSFHASRWDSCRGADGKPRACKPW